MKKEFGFGDKNWFEDMLQDIERWPLAGKHFTSTGIQGLDDAISKVMRLNKVVQSIGKK